MPANHIGQIMHAYEFGAAAHQGQTRMSGEPFISHPIAVAQELANMHMDAPTITAAILHDVVEDTSTTLDGISQEFNNEIATLVDGVSKLDQMHFHSHAEAQTESFRKMMLAMIEDIRVILIKLADRLHNMQTLDAMPRDKQTRIARETIDIYAPIANRLGINRMKVSLEELGLRYLYPFRHRVLKNALKKSKGNQRQIVNKISKILNKSLEAEGIEGEIVGREKRLYSIYKKMAEKKLLLSNIVDVYGFRIIVNDVNTCYQVLGLVHSLYKPMPGRFKDYIAIPRINGYQSLHTILFGPKGLPLEVQIRTVDMHRVAESGVAAHWQYKAEDKTSTTPQHRTRDWLANLVEIQQSGSSEEFLEKVKVDLFPDKIYVFTPGGDIMPLPKGSTTVDFAYAVHTDIGNRCVAAKIDRHLVPLRTQLQNSQTIQIITDRKAKPNPNWVTFVVTVKARSAIHQYMKNLRASASIELGKRLLNHSLKDLNSSLRKVGKIRIQKTLEALNIKNTSELFEQLGLGERLAPLTARFLIGITEDGNIESATAKLVIAGTEGIVVTYAKCCHPIPGDSVMGYLSSGKGIVIHRNYCGNMINFRKQPEKWITVSWQKLINRSFSSQIQVDTENKTGVLAEVAATIADSDSNIEQVSVLGQHDDSSRVISFIVQVRDRTHLEQIILNVRNMKNIIRVSRDST